MADNNDLVHYFPPLLFFQDRINTEKAVFNPNHTFGEGSVYFASAAVDLNSNQDVTLQIIADTIKVNNNANMTARFYGDVFYQAPRPRSALTG